MASAVFTSRIVMIPPLEGTGSLPLSSTLKRTVSVGPLLLTPATRTRQCWNALNEQNEVQEQCGHAPSIKDSQSVCEEISLGSHGSLIQNDANQRKQITTSMEFEA